MAVLPVILYHAGFTTLFGGGFVGVDIFFVISGYLITSILIAECRQGTYSLIRFYERRVRRIWPAFFIVALFTFLCGVWLYTPIDLMGIAKSIQAACLIHSNVYFFHDGGYFDGPAHIKPFLHTWSLGVEEQFYVIFPVLLYFLSRFPRLLIPVLAAIAAFSFAASVQATAEHPDAAFYLLHNRAWELLLGALLAVKKKHHWTKGQADVMGWLGLGLIGGAVVGYGYIERLYFPGVGALAPCLGAALCIEAGTVKGNAVERLLSVKPLVVIGLLSYSLYLWHWPIYVFYQYRYAKFGFLSASEGIALLGVTFFCAMVSWHLIEQPVRRRKILLSRRMVFSTALCTLGCLYAAGAYCALNGLPWRFSPETLVYAQQGHTKQLTRSRLPSIPKAIRKYCYDFGVPGEKPTVLLLGDSHSFMLGQLFDEEAKRHGYSGLNVYMQEPLFGTFRTTGSMKKRIRQRHEAVLELIRKNNIQTVVLAGRWGKWVNGPTAYEAPLRKESGTLRALTPDGAVIADPLKALEQGLEETVATLRGMGVSVWLVLPVPEQEQDIPKQATRYSRFGQDPKDIFVAYSAYRKRQENVLPVLRQQAGRVHYIDPALALCPQQERCMAVSDDGSLYSDDNHLSAAGTALLKPLFQTLFSHLASTGSPWR